MSLKQLGSVLLDSPQGDISCFKYAFNVSLCCCFMIYFLRVFDFGFLGGLMVTSSTVTEFFASIKILIMTICVQPVEEY